MSLLLNESFANNQTPLFLTTQGGGSVTGNLNLSGNLTVGGLTTLKGIVETEDVVNMYAGTAAPTPSLQLIPTVGPAGMEIRTDGVIGFGVLNLATPPQTTLDTSATPGGDVLTVGGAIIGTTLAGIGPAPVSLINSTKTINPVPAIPTPAQGFPVDVNVPTAPGQEYDIMTRGLITLVSGTPSPQDYIVVTLDSGTSISTNAVWSYIFQPPGTGGVFTSDKWQVRDRIISDAVTATVFVSVQHAPFGGSTAVYSMSQFQFDLVRVK